MKRWKIIIEYKGNTMEIIVDAKFYSDAYLEAERKFPGCIIKSILEIRG
jgi:hypothetical protein